MKHKMLRIEPRLAFINGVLLANRVLIFRFQLLAVYVLLVHSCGECRIEIFQHETKSPTALHVDVIMELSRYIQHVTSDF
jgi:hypothetical protein